VSDPISNARAARRSQQPATCTFTARSKESSRVTLPPDDHDFIAVRDLGNVTISSNAGSKAQSKRLGAP